ncbi:MAG TPA: hypothetical protein VF363_00385 [Candidatus Eisenbacteria bacterium]
MTVRPQGTIRPSLAWLLAASLLALAPGCASGPRLYVNSEADLAFYKKIAVLPFTNLSAERFAGERVTRGFLVELTMAERYQIVDPAEFLALLDKMGGLPGSNGIYDPAKLKDAATQVGANAVLRGAVTEFRMQRTGNSEIPVVAFDVELIDVATSNVIWRGSIGKRGKGRVPVFGGGQRTYAGLVESASRELVGRLEKEGF